MSSCSLCCAGAGNSGVAASYAGPAAFYSGATQKYYFNYTDSAKVLNAVGTPALNGIAVQTVNPESGGVATLTCSQTTVINQPTCVTSALGSFQAVQWASSGSQAFNLAGTGNTAVVQGTTAVSFGAVVKPTLTSTNSFLFRIFDNPFSFNRFRCSINGTLLIIDVEAVDGAGDTPLQTATSTVAAGTWYALLFEWNVTTGATTIYLNGASQSLTGTAATPGTMSNTTGNSPQIGLNTSNIQELECFLFVGGLMGATNAAAWSTAVRANYGF